MADEIRRVADLLSAPMEQVIVAIGTAIGRAQRELDRFAIQTQREINEDPTLVENGIQPTFYQIPRAELELTTAIVLEDDGGSAPSSAPLAIGAATLPLKVAALSRVHLQPVNAAYTNQFNFDVNASSRVKLTIVPVPPPAAADAVTPRLSQQEVIKVASPKLATATNVRLAVNFNGQSRLWFVVQYQIDGDTTKRLALVVVDDETKQIVKAEA